MKEGCKVSCVTIIAWLIVFKEVTNTQFFYISDYGVKYGAECCAESGAKEYFIKQRNVVRHGASFEFWFLDRIFILFEDRIFSR